MFRQTRKSLRHCCRLCGESATSSRDLKQHHADHHTTQGAWLSQEAVPSDDDDDGDDGDDGDDRDSDQVSEGSASTSGGDRMDMSDGDQIADGGPPLEGKWLRDL